jgi:dephospho-CoA kinase
MNTTDPNKQNLWKCIQTADFMIKNDGTKEELILKVENVLQQITGIR